MASPSFRSEQSPIILEEQSSSEIHLDRNDSEYLARIGFDVIPADVASEGLTTTSRIYRVNPKQFVGHFLLPSDQIVCIRPKIPEAGVFRMLAYVYPGFDREVFRPEEVSYESDKLLFEPLVERFNELVSNRARRGLYQDYIRHEENLGVLRGAVETRRHLLENWSRPDRIVCRFYDNTVDNEDNQIAKWTLYFLLRCQPWSPRTMQILRANLHQFTNVTLRRPGSTAFARRHYHRLNDDYEAIHILCKLFLERVAFCERVGNVAFRGFLMDMNQLFEDFVTQAFLKIFKTSGLSVFAQRWDYLSAFPIRIKPDVIVQRGANVLAIADAKYKRAVDDRYENHDVYQMLAYGTALKCPRTYLLFPSSEIQDDAFIKINNSPVTITIRRVDLTNSQCVGQVEEHVRRILDIVRAGMKSQPVEYRDALRMGSGLPSLQ